MKRKVLAAIVGGVAAGFLSGIPIVGWFWFFWAVLGGLLATFLFYRKVGASIQITDGLIVGGLAGLVAGIVNILEVLGFAAVGALISVLTQPGSSDDKLGAFGVAIMLSMFSVVFNIVWSVLILIFSTLAGLVLALILNSTNKPAEPAPLGVPGNFQ